MDEISRIFRRLRENEEKQKKFNQIELAILSILNFRDLFEILLSEIKNKFKIPYVWISIVDESNLAPLIKSLEKSDHLSGRLNIIKKEEFFPLLKNGPKPILANSRLKRFYKLFPRQNDYLIKSIAVAPLLLDGDIIGSLNQADVETDRFAPDMDPDYLEQLVTKVSICLSNVTAHERLRYFAYRDPLTGLWNRRVMTDILEKEFSRSKRYDKPLCVLFLDIDYFKKVNDQYGHDQGDALLVFTAEKMMSIIREADLAARYAGDEFVIILPETKPDQAKVLADRLMDAFRSTPLVMGDKSITISMSYGLASSDAPDVTDAASLIKKADANLYIAKRKRPGEERLEACINMSADMRKDR